MGLFGAEPEGADDAARSLEADERVGPFTANTICDGLRTLIGEPNFHVLREQGVTVLRVSDAEVVAAMRLLWSELRIVVEPSSATVLAALLRYPERVVGRRVGAVLTGGNVDLDDLPW
jgi:threonine dehydratase